MKDLIVIGAGPAGLSCAIEAKKAGLSVLVLEQGSLTEYIRRFPTNLVWFSTAEMLEIGEVPFVVSTVRPTRVDTLNYYQKVVRVHGLEIRYHDAVTALRRDRDAFITATRKEIAYQSRYVVVATGYFDQPNRLDVPGEDLPAVSHYYDEPFRYFDLRITVVGGRNSAVEAALDLQRHGAHVTLVHRRERLSEGVKYWILPDIENRIKAGQITAFFSSTVKEFRNDSVVLRTPEGERSVPTDYSFVLVGFRPDTRQLRSFGIDVDPATLAPAVNADSLETNVPGLYVAGSVVAGKDTNKIFIENGRLHGGVILRSILAKRS